MTMKKSRRNPPRPCIVTVDAERESQRKIIKTFEMGEAELRSE